MARYLGIDVGTSAVKAVVVDERGVVIGSSSASVPIAHPRPTWSEQDPDDWWAAAASAARGALAGSPGDVSAIGLSGQMHGSVLLGEDAEGSGGRAAALRPAILWNDQRSAGECAWIESAAGGRRAMLDLVGNAALPGFTLPKLLWLRRHEPGVWSRVRRVMLPKDFVAFRLTGRVVTDTGDAAGTLLLDVARREWSSRMMALAGMDERLLPTVVESATVVGEASAWSAERLGVRAGVPVVIGSGDNMTGAVGTGVVEPGMVLASLGTSGVILAHADRPVVDVADAVSPGRLHTMCAATGPDGWCLTGCTLSAGGALAWARGVLAPGEPFERVVAEAASAPAGCEGLVFLPHLTGERCPHPDPMARGGWIGLTARHGRAHLLRAVIEGVTFVMGDILEIARSLGLEVRSVRVTGGGNRSAWWRQLQADVYGARIESAGAVGDDGEGGCAIGAALVAASAVGAGSIADLASRWIGVREACEPAARPDERLMAARSARQGAYDDLRDRFVELGANGG